MNPGTDILRGIVALLLGGVGLLIALLVLLLPDMGREPTLIAIMIGEVLVAYSFGFYVGNDLKFIDYGDDDSGDDER